MERFDYLIIGGGVAGMTAAETIRSLDRDGAIAVLASESHRLYSRVLLPHYVKGMIPRERLFLRDQAHAHRSGIRVLLGVGASSLRLPGREVNAIDGRTFAFGKLLIASGGEPKPAGLPGASLDGVTRFQTLEDAERIRALAPSARRAVVFGSGFIALEYLEVLAARGIATTLVFRDRHVFPRALDAAGASLLEEGFAARGITILRDDTLVELSGRARLEGVRTAGGASLACDFLGIGIGLERNVGWLAGSLGASASGVPTDPYLETDTPGVFAAGDVAAIPDAATGTHRSRGNWGNAVAQGGAAGWNMARPEAKRPFTRPASYAIRNLGAFIAFVGEVGSGRTLSRSVPAARRYCCFFLGGDDRLRGAALINEPELVAAVTALIERGVEIPQAAEQLPDPTFDLATLLRAPSP